MITVELALAIHRVLLSRYGGAAGVRDQAGLAAAIHRPFQTFDGQDLYPTAVEKAAAIIESIIVNHPFLDGNKRTGYVLMRMLLLDDGKDIDAQEEEKYEFVMRIAAASSSYADILAWLRARVVDKS